LRHCATSRKIAGLIPDGVSGIFHCHNPSGHTMALESTQPLTEISTRNISWRGKGGRCVGLTTLPPSCADCLEIWEPQPPGTLRACNGIALPLLACTTLVTNDGFNKKRPKHVASFRKWQVFAKVVATDGRSTVSVGLNRKKWFSYQGTPTLTGTWRAEL
jgi:hypothetical protein